MARFETRNARRCSAAAAQTVSTRPSDRPTTQHELVVCGPAPNIRRAACESGTQMPGAAARPLVRRLCGVSRRLSTPLCRDAWRRHRGGTPPEAGRRPGGSRGSTPTPCRGDRRVACWRYGTREATEMLAVCVVLNFAGAALSRGPASAREVAASAGGSRGGAEMQGPRRTSGRVGCCTRHLHQAQQTRSLEGDSWETASASAASRIWVLSFWGVGCPLGFEHEPDRADPAPGQMGHWASGTSRWPAGPGSARTRPAAH